jgi:hypothetical protein
MLDCAFELFAPTIEPKAAMAINIDLLNKVFIPNSV